MLDAVFLDCDRECAGCLRNRCAPRPLLDALDQRHHAEKDSNFSSVLLEFHVQLQSLVRVTASRDVARCVGTNNGAVEVATVATIAPDSKNSHTPILEKGYQRIQPGLPADRATVQTPSMSAKYEYRASCIAVEFIKFQSQIRRKRSTNKPKFLPNCTSDDSTPAENSCAGNAIQILLPLPTTNALPCSYHAFEIHLAFQLQMRSPAPTRPSKRPLLLPVAVKSNAGREK